MSYFAGIDLHKRYLTLCVLDPIGNVVVQHRRLTTDGLFAVLAELDAPITVAVEATLHWAWLHDRLVAQGYTVQVADPGQVKLISKARCKTDPIDARKLADLLRSNLLPAIWVPDPTTRANRKLLRGYAFLVRSRTRIKNRIHAYLAEINLASPATDLFGKQGRIWIDSLTLPDEVRFQVDGLLELLDFLETPDPEGGQAHRATGRHHPRGSAPAHRPRHRGQDRHAHHGRDRRPSLGFPTSHDLTSFAGLVPTTRSSGGKTTHGSLPRAGSPWLRWALVETTQTLKMKPGPVRAHFTRLTRAKGNSKATVAAARKLCCYLFWMLKEERTYPEWLQNRHSQPPAGGAPDVTPGALHTGRRQTGWATSFEHGILCQNAHEEAVEVFFYLLPCEVHGPGGSAPPRVWMRFFQTPGIPLPLALFLFQRGRYLGKGNKRANPTFSRPLELFQSVA